MLTNQGYAAEAPELLTRYEAKSSERIHADWLHLFPSLPCDVLDIGAGTGRDAGWFAGKGCSVLAVEPTAELREPAKTLHPEPAITWLDDALPDLARARALGQSFDFVLLTAVWMHLDVGQRAAAMPHIAGLMRPGARAFFMVRHGPVPKGRRMFEISPDETISLAETSGMSCLYTARIQSIQAQNRAAGIEWTKHVFERN